MITPTPIEMIMFGQFILIVFLLMFIAKMNNRAFKQMEKLLMYERQSPSRVILNPQLNGDAQALERDTLNRKMRRDDMTEFEIAEQKKWD